MEANGQDLENTKTPIGDRDSGLFHSKGTRCCLKQAKLPIDVFLLCFRTMSSLLADKRRGTLNSSSNERTVFSRESLSVVGIRQEILLGIPLLSYRTRAFFVFLENSFLMLLSFCIALLMS